MTSKKVTVEMMRELMDNPHCVRNMSVIAHVDHGKSTLTDSLLAANDLISQADIGNKRATDTDEKEKEKGITIHSTGVSLIFNTKDCENGFVHTSGIDRFLINLIDSPGHVDFSSEVTAALRLTDGALVLVDCVEGACVQTETVLRQALQERIKPVLAINKLDRAFLELQLTSEEIYLRFCRWISDVNGIISTYEDETMGELTVSPIKGTVAFSAGKQGWAFTLRDFARMYAKDNKSLENKWVERLWGENFFDEETKKWTTSPVSDSGKKLPRGFCHFVLDPIRKVFDASLKKDYDTLNRYLERLGMPLTKEQFALSEKDLLKSVMHRWLPAHRSLLEMITVHLPSPKEAQRYRVELLYKGPLDDDTAQAIRECDPNGPFVMYIAKMIPTKDGSRFNAFGRVFSGTAKAGKCHVMGSNFEMGKKDDLFLDKSIQRVVIMMCGKPESVENVPCGNTAALVGVDSYLVKSGTVVSDRNSYPIVNMKYSVSPVVRVAVAPKVPSDIHRLVEALKKLTKTDSLIQCTMSETGEHILAGAGELHLEICSGRLVDLMGGSGVVFSDPVVSLRETVIAQSRVCLSKSPNSHNRLYATSEPLGSELTEAIKGFDKGDFKEVSKKLVTEYRWDPDQAKKIWAFGPEIEPSNVFVDTTKGVQFLNEIKENVVAGFQWFSRCGVLCEEELRGVKFDLRDCVLHADSIHRGGGQIIPCTKRVLAASQLTASPRLLEPVYLVDIQAHQDVIHSVYAVVTKRRGSIIEQIPREGTPLYNLKGHLPVLESFGFDSALREATSGQAFPLLIFDHWDILESDPFVPGTAKDLISATRKRKGLNVEIPPLDRYLDRL
eukprot:TRINITY_DN20_c0_g1_i1.p1 TRINITY_DN20_c0_g1~~TRINITY_DN20_c0_g1_i1.p1  ORF type:complete len:839 (-),score=289.83 TRINITY_DN20_c0_g1_i1:83-2599(-)